MTTTREALLATLAQVINAFDSEISTGPGAIRSLLLSPAVVLAEYSEAQVEALLDRYDLSQLTSVTAADILDEIAARYGVSRGNESAASGVLTIIVDEAFPVVIPAGTRFQGAAGTYRAVNSFAFRTASSSVISTTDRLLIARGDGTYIADINVVAEFTGSIYNLAQGESLEVVDTIEHVLGAYAASDFVGGSDREEGASLISRIQDSFTRPGTESTYGISALIKNPGAFPLVEAVSVVGAGDAEMLRDKVNPLGIGGGMADVYVRTRTASVSAAITKTGTDEGSALGKRTWEIRIGRDDFPGFWDVIEVRDSTGAKAEIVSDTRHVDLSGEAGQLIPIIPSKLHGVYSAFQTSVLLVKTVDTYSAGIFSVTLRGMPDIGSIQRLLGSRSYRAVGGDLLVKAPVPCFVSVTVTIMPLSASSLTPTDAELVELVVNAVNNSEFAGVIYASQIAEAVKGDQYTVVSVTMRGTTLMPDGESETSISEQRLEIPVRRDNQTSWRTGIFVTSPTSISINRQSPVSELIR